MVNDELLKFIKSFNQLIKANASAQNKGEIPNLSSEHVEQLYFSICDLLSDLGYSIISKSVYKELFELHSKDAAKANNSPEETLLTFFLQLASADTCQSSGISKYLLNCDNYMAAYDLLYSNRVLEIGSPLSNSFSFIYDQQKILQVFIENEIVQIRKGP